MKKICFTNISRDSFWQLPQKYKEELIAEFGESFQLEFVESTSGMRQALGDAHMIVGMPFSQGAIRKNQLLEKVHFWTAQVPLSWQAKSEIEISSSSGINSSSVAEHALFLTMKALRGEVGSEELRHDEFLIAQAPKDLTLGVMGLGNISKEFISLASPLFGSTIACSRTKKDIQGLGKFFSLSERSEFYKQCDYLVVALPLTDDTKELFDTAFYDDLRKDITIINIARGELFDEAQLTSFLGTHQKSRYLTDVTYPEPYPEDGMLRDLDNVFITPHIGGRREDIWKLLVEKTKEEIRKLEK